MGNDVRNHLLRRARKGKGWTQEELAERMGVALATVKSWERGSRSPSLQLRARLCTLFGLTAAQLGFEPDDPEEHLQKEAQTVRRRTEQDLNRKTMLKRVDDLWISGVLNHSLTQKTVIHLRLRQQPDAVLNPWAEAVQEANLPSEPLPAGTLILGAYDDAGGALLLLGEPGAGKTTMLLELARDLLERASLDEAHPIPVVFHLSSWAQKRPTFQDWMIEELHDKYQVPYHLAKEWGELHHILPLLDGLDEVVETARTACVQALNVYRKAHGFLPMVVCSRTNEYGTLSVRLALHRALTIESLTFQQIEVYITKTGKRLEAVQTALERDASLQDMVKTPLMLSIIAQVFQNNPLDPLLSVEDPTERRRLLFKKYIEVLLGRRGAKKHYTPEQMIHWLAWLARYMQQHNQTQFYLEHLQPDALEQQTSYRNMVIRLIFGLNFLIDAGLYACFRGDSEPAQPGLFYWLGGNGLGNTILGWMAPGLGGDVRGGGSLGFITFIVEIVIMLIAGHASTLDLSLHALQRGVRVGLRNGLLFGTIVAVLSTLIWYGSGKSLSYSLNQGIGLWLFEGSLVGLIVGLTAGLRAPHTTPPALSFLDRLINFGVFAMCATVGMTSIYSLQAGTINSAILTYGVLAGIGVGAAFSFGRVTDLIPSIGNAIEPAEIVAWSWSHVLQELPTSFKKGLLLAGAIALPTIIVLSIASGAFYGLSYGWHYGLIYGSIVGMINGVAAVLTSILDSGWSGGLLTDDQRQRPNEGIHNSFKHALIAACVFGPIGGIISAICCGFAFKAAGVPGWFTLFLGFSLISSIIFAIRFWIAYGGRAWIEHLLLRWSLARAGSLPYKVIPFLNYATERAILRRVGGGYLFSHRLLLDYFAHLSESRDEHS
jgi:transcriptional regulator with XRE-family HTH domain